MTQGHNINALSAFIAGHWTDDIREELLTHRPAGMTLSGDWSDLSVFAGLVDSVEALMLEGSIERGGIRGIDGIEAFASLRRLRMASKVKSGIRPFALPLLETLHARWEPGLIEVIDNLPALQTISIGGYSGSTLEALPTKRTITRLGLTSSAIASLDGLGSFPALASLEVSGATKLATLRGIEAASLSSLYVQSARQLIDFAPIRSVQSLDWVRLLHINELANTAPLYELQNLRSLQIGGTRVPLIDWPSALRMPRIENVVGWWDPSLISEEDIRRSVRPGRRIAKFETFSKAKVRPLQVMVEDDA